MSPIVPILVIAVPVAVIVGISEFWVRSSHALWVQEGRPARPVPRNKSDVKRWLDNSGMTWWQWVIYLPLGLAMGYLLLLSPLLLQALGQIIAGL